MHFSSFSSSSSSDDDIIYEVYELIKLETEEAMKYMSR